MGIIPFHISVPVEQLESLREQLAQSNFPSDISGTDDWARGPPLSAIKRLARTWEHEFDWRRVESELNKLPQFVVDVEIPNFGSYKVHCVHQRSTVETAIPLLFLHGWPGSFVEVSKILPSLTSCGKSFPAFHVVAPSLIDFGFSAPSAKAGFNIDQHADAYHQLMENLGYAEYVVQGGDLGSATARVLASKYGPVHCKAHHVNTAAPAEPTVENFPELFAKVQTTSLTEEELTGLSRTQAFGAEGNAFYKLQCSRPLTLAYSLASSPVGLLSWLYEKLHDWTDSYPWTDTEILTWVSIYWFSTSGPAANLNIYYENEHRHPKKAIFEQMQEYVSNVPLGVSRFPKDLVLLPKLWHHTMGQIVFLGEHSHGGHFPAWECPEDLVSDLRDMFGKGGGAYGYVGVNDGYSHA